jgi:aminoglycoside 6'-N-acetyltransferase I
MSIRPIRLEDEHSVLRMMHILWPDFDDDYSGESVLVWERPDGTLGAFASFSVRPWADGCKTSPVPYVEGWWVAPDLRRLGIGRALIHAIEKWARDNGYTELGSDAELDNVTSLAAHAALGFQPTQRVQFFRKTL